MIAGDIAARIYSYMAGIVKEHGAVSLSINGMPDHVHLLIKSSKSVSDSDFMKALKGGSSRWINDIDLIPGHFKWQAGYGWFSVSPKGHRSGCDFYRKSGRASQESNFSRGIPQVLENLPDRLRRTIRLGLNDDSCVPSGRLTILNQSPRIEIRGC